MPYLELLRLTEFISADPTEEAESRCAQYYNMHVRGCIVQTWSGVRAGSVVVVGSEDEIVRIVDVPKVYDLL